MSQLILYIPLYVANNVIHAQLPNDTNVQLVVTTAILSRQYFNSIAHISANMHIEII